MNFSHICFQGQIRYHSDIGDGLAVLDVSWYTSLLSARYENQSDLAENYTKSLAGDTPVSRENKVLKSVSERLPQGKVFTHFLHLIFIL